VAVTGIRAISAAEGIVLSAETTGKYKMTAQVLAIMCLIVADSVDPGWNIYAIGHVLLYGALLLGLISGAKYLITFWRQVSLKGL
jgi:CDP-diacylglycerol---glycerol-3-phosphate 3-phosphatidyltransferase